MMSAPNESTELGMLDSDGGTMYIDSSQDILRDRLHN